MSNIKIAIADDHSLMREGLSRILEFEDDITVVGTAKDGLEALELYKKMDIDVVLLDINMPNMNGIETLRKIRDMDSSAKVIILTVHDGREYLVESLNLGANGYMLKDSDSSSLVEAIKAVNQGGSYVHPNLAGELVREISKTGNGEKAKKGLESLTKREYEVLSLIADGLSNKEISQKLIISEKTVKNHVSSILRKLEISDRTQAAIYAYKHNVKKI
ncbi:MAG: response regulator transcription factor [Peptostreptococcaceae bacterium]|jgi:DNA-binding NarL/FixJ family response regulator|nr:response regulator transcription factor [Peptostreptococcaceae bacterium]